MSVSRRTLFPLDGLAAAAGLSNTGGAAPVMDANTGGLRVTLIWYEQAWHVYVPDWEIVDSNAAPTGFASYISWVPGHPIVFRRVPLEEYLAQVEQVCGLKKRA